jgi:predicted TIM-barrel fold metal-dependent hydrolase
VLFDHHGEEELPDWIAPETAVLSTNATPTLMGALARDFPEAKLIIGHMGGGMFYDAMCMAKRHPNLYIDVSLQGGHAFAAACDEVGPHKLIYGSDAPYASPGSMKRIIEESRLPDCDKAAVLGGNVARLLNLVMTSAG